MYLHTEILPPKTEDKKKKKVFIEIRPGLMGGIPSCEWEGCWIETIFKVPSSPRHPMILWGPAFAPMHQMHLEEKKKKTNWKKPPHPNSGFSFSPKYLQIGIHNNCICCSLCPRLMFCWTVFHADAEGRCETDFLNWEFLGFQWIRESNSPGQLGKYCLPYV